MKYLFVYLIFISSLAVILTIYDKLSAVLKKGSRVRESLLFFIGFAGGAAFMYITMKLIHHKTLHKSFMYGLPLMIFAQIVILVFVGGWIK